MKKNAQAGFGVVLAIVLGMALSGTVGMVSPEDSIAASCYDSSNNDGDQVEIAPGVYSDLVDQLDPECKWMPFKFGQGEYDGLDATISTYTVNSADVSNYVQTWRTIDNYPTYFAALVSLDALTSGGGIECHSQVQDAMIEYRDTYNMPDEKTGVSEHQSHCGVSY